MSRRGWALVAIGFLFVLGGAVTLLVGLDAANKIAGVIGALCSLVGLAFAGYPIFRSRPVSRTGSNESGNHFHFSQYFTAVFGNVYEGKRESSKSLAVVVGVVSVVAIVALTIVNVVLVVETLRSSARAESRADRQAEPLTTQVTPSPTAQPSAPSLVRPDKVREVSVRVPDGKPATVDDVEIAVDTVAYVGTADGSASCGGGGNGPGGGSCGVTPGDSQGSSTIGVVDFSVITPALTCKASGVQENESVVIDTGSSWTRIVVRSIGPVRSANQSRVTFKVSIGHGRPAPESSKTCVSS